MEPEFSKYSSEYYTIYSAIRENGLIFGEYKAITSSSCTFRVLHAQVIIMPQSTN